MFSGVGDNQGAMQLMQNPVTNSNSKHIDACHHCFGELVHQEGISVIRVPSAYQHADIFMKADVYDASSFTANELKRRSW